jgi:hypothetical protein
MVVYAFDVDETLEVSNGPVKLLDLAKLREQGHIVGLCGNWAAFPVRATTVAQRSAQDGASSRKARSPEGRAEPLAHPDRSPSESAAVGICFW